MTSSALALVLLLSQLPSAPLPLEEAKRTIDPADEEALNASFLDVKAETLLDFFRLRTSRTTDAERIGQLAEQLGSKDTNQRHLAARTFVGLGVLALPTLRNAHNDGMNRPRAALAEKCLELIRLENSVDLQLRAIRVLNVHRPEQLTEVMLAYLPLAEDEEIVEKSVELLTKIDRSKAAPDSALLEALVDSVPIRRIIATRVLAHREELEERFRPLLTDPKPTVRKRVALTLAAHNHPEALPVLIDLLAELPTESRGDVEAYLNELAGEWAVQTPTGDDRVSRRLRRQLWTGWWQEMSGEVLLAELRSRTPADEEYQRLSHHIDELGSNDPKIRDNAFAELRDGGLAAAALLRQAVASDNSIVETKAEEILELLEPTLDPVPIVAIRLLSLRRPNGALEALLAYYPFASDQNDREVIVTQIGHVGFRGGRPKQPLVRALGDPLARRRTAAAIALCRWGNAEAQKDVQPLLADPVPSTRMQVAFAMARQQHRSAVPALINLLPIVNSDEAYLIEDLLIALADHNAPKTSLAEDVDSRTVGRDAWAKWWQTEKGNIDLSVLATQQQSTSKLLVIETYNSATRVGRVIQLDRRGKKLWEIGSLKYPMYAEVLGPNRVLIAEQSANQITERDLKGKVLRTFSMSSPTYCKRLRNGITFIANRQTMQELDEKGNPIVTFNAIPGQSIIAIEKFRNGEIAYLTYQGHYVRTTAKGKTIKQYRVPYNPQMGITGGQVLPRDRVLVAQSNARTVTEYDQRSKVLWKSEVNLPTYPTRLPNGNTLIVGSSGNEILTVNRVGKVIETQRGFDFRAYRIIDR